MPDLDIAQKLGQQIQIAFDLLKEAQKAFDKSDAIRGGIFTAASHTFLQTIINKTNFLAPLQMSIMPNGLGKVAVNTAIADASRMITEFEKLYKEKNDAPDKVSN